MELMRKYIWLFVVVVIFFVSMLIVLVFLLINKCIARQGKLRMWNLHRGSDSKIESNKYQERNLDAKIPPLPPRTQFLTAEAQSYENLAEGSDGEQSFVDYEEIDDHPPESVKVEEEAEMLPPPPPCYSDPKSNLKSGDSLVQSYENLAEDHDYEQSTDEQPDYINVEDETAILPPPVQYSDPAPNLNHCVSVGQSYENLAEEHDYEQSTDEQPDYVKVEDEEDVCPHPADSEADNTSTEDYDDIGGEDENQDEDDYDDVV